MRVHIAKAEGSVSPTVVIDGSQLNYSKTDMISLLEEINTILNNSSKSLFSKYVIIKPSSHPMYDFDYLFIQMIPGSPPTFDFKGSCGHSILSSIRVAMEWKWIGNVSPGRKIRIFIENIGDSVVCEIDKLDLTSSIECTAHFINNSGTKLKNMLPTGRPIDVIKTNLGEIDVSIVSAGNPYVFINCNDLGIYNEEELFEENQVFFDQLQIIRKEVSKILGWNPDSVFPKIAAYGNFKGKHLSVRAISVPVWHPTLALTGVACLSVAASIKDTVVYNTASKLIDNNSLHIRTKGGETSVSCKTTGNTLDDSLLYSSISNKKVHLLNAVYKNTGEEFKWQQDQQLQKVMS